jgi:2,5-diamino-6-(ribosylamino)-4(3H)-pyrimidinone 5'-phosphate reductase
VVVVIRAYISARDFAAEKVIRLYGVKVIVGGFMSMDGKIAPADGIGRKFFKFMTPRHQRMLHKIRSGVDAIIVGVETVIVDNPSLTVRNVHGKNPLRVVLDSNARTPLDSKVMDGAAPTIIAVTQNAPKRRIESLRKKTEVLVLKRSRRVDLRDLLRELRNRGVHRVLVEGGGETRWSFFKEGLVDDFFVWITLHIWGGRDAPTLVDGDGFLHEEDAVPLRLKSRRIVDNVLILSFHVGASHG